MYLQDFFDYKNRFMEDILTEPKVIELLNDFDDRKPATAEELMYTQVFPFELSRHSSRAQ